MQENPFENIDSHEHIPPSSESAEQPPRTKRVMRHIQQRFAKTIYYEKDLLQNNLNKKMLREDEKDQYRNVLLQNMDKLIDVGLIIGDDGKYYFHNFANDLQGPNIEGKHLRSFPNAEFLRKYGIIHQSAESMKNKNQVEKLFAVLLGAEKIATEEDYKKLFASQLEGIVPELKKIGLEFRDGKYYFYNLGARGEWPKIEGKHLRNFPNAEFLRKYGIIDQNAGYIYGNSQVEKLFAVLLGAEKIATEEDYKKLFASQLEGLIPELEKVGLEFRAGKYYFHNLGTREKWPKIEGKGLKNFPSTEFLKKHGIIAQHNDSISNRSQLAKLFEVLGFKVWYEPPKSRKRTQHEIKNLTPYIAALRAIIPEFEKIGLEFRDGKYYFHNLAGEARWPRIEGKKLTRFPNRALLIELGVISENALGIYSRNELAKLMEVLLGVEVATEEDYKKLFASQLEGLIPELEKVGLEFRAGKYYFHNLGTREKWPKIEEKNLASFPNAEFLRKHGILEKHQQAMTNIKQLAKLFYVLGFPIDEKLLEEIQNEK